MKKIKILFLIHDLSHGGAERVLVNLVNNIDKEKYDVTLLSLFRGGINEKYLSKNIKYKTIFNRTFPGNSRLMMILSPSMLHRLYIKDHYDIEVSYLEGPCTRIISGCESKNTKLVAWVHSDFSVENNNPYASFKNKKEAINCYSKFDEVVGVSQQVLDDFKKFYPNVKSTCVLYNTNETNKIVEKAKEVIDDIYVKSDEINIFSAGKLTEIKGFYFLPKVIRKLRDDGFPAHMYILGTGEEEEMLKKEAREYSVENYFDLLGFEENPYKYLSKANLYVCSSIREGFSTAVTEALVLGIPVVSTRCAGTDELLGHNNEYGIIVDASSESIYLGIKDMLSNNNLEYYAKQAKERSSLFSIEATTKAVQDMFCSLLD